jgi:hypothetical protein
VKKRGPDKRRTRRHRNLAPLATWTLIAAAAGAVAFLVVYAATSGGGSGANTDFSAQTAKMPSDPAKGQPFQGGPRLYFPVASMDLGQVPFDTPVSDSFDLRNVGDAPLSIQDVQVNMLEGC